VEYVISSMLEGNPAYVGAPSSVRDYMYIDDHVSAYLLAIENKVADRNVFNVSPGNPVSNIEVAKRIAKMLGASSRIVEGSYPPGYPMRPGKVDTDYIVLDSSAIRTKLGWKPTITLDEGLKKTIELWKSM
jgi:dTDP-glucose 4,6-dehydratase